LLPLLSGGENGWAQKLLGTKPAEAAPRVGATADFNALDRRSGIKEQRPGTPVSGGQFRPRQETEEEEGEVDEDVQFGNKIQPAR
jgi:hypothetical protein